MSELEKNLEAIAVFSPGLASSLRVSVSATQRLDSAVASASSTGEWPLDRPAHHFVAGTSHSPQVVTLLQDPPRESRGLGRDYIVRLVEPDLDRLRDFLARHDLTEAVRARRTRIFGGPTLAEDLRRDLLQRHVSRAIRVQGGDPAARDVIAKVSEAAKRWDLERMLKCRDRLAARVPQLRQKWTDVAAGKKIALRVALLTQRDSTYVRFGIEAIAAAVAGAGHEPHLVPDDDPMEDTTQADLLEFLEDRCADALFVINAVRGDPPLVPRPIPFLSWAMDRGLSPAWQALERELLREHDHILSDNRDAWVEKGLAKSRAHAFPTPANAAVLEAAGDSNPVPVVAEVGYVGSFFGHPERAWDELRQQAKASPPVHVLLEQAAEALFSRREELPPTDAEYAAHFRAIRKEGPTEWALCDRLRARFNNHVVGPWYRLRQLERLAEAGVDLALFGHRWDQHVPLARFSRGPVEGPAELARAYRSTRLQLQLMYGNSLHQRFVDAAAIGVCTVIRRYPWDLTGLVKRESDPAGPLSRPDGIADSEWAFLLDLLATAGFRLATDDETRRRIALRRAPLSVTDVLPREIFEVVTAGSHGGLAQCLERLLHDPELRARTAREVQRRVQEHFEPVRLVRRTLGHIASTEAEAWGASRGPARSGRAKPKRSSGKRSPARRRR